MTVVTAGGAQVWNMLSETLYLAIVGDPGGQRVIPYIDQPVVSKPDGDRRLGEVVDGLGTNSHEAVEICRGRVSLKLEAESAIGRQRGFTAPPAVLSADIGARSGTHEGATSFPISGSQTSGPSLAPPRISEISPPTQALAMEQNTNE